MKFSLLLILLFSLNNKYSWGGESITCPVGVITASDKLGEEDVGWAQEIVLQKNNENSFVGEVKLLNRTFAMIIYKDELIDLYEASSVLLDDKGNKLVTDGFLLKYSGKGDGDWHGPVGTEFLSLIYNSLGPLPARFVITWDAYKILNKYGVTRRFVINPYEFEGPLSEAIRDGHIKKGEIVAMGIALGCSLRK